VRESASCECVDGSEASEREVEREVEQVIDRDGETGTGASQLV
jgi:hypothetical protein